MLDDSQPIFSKQQHFQLFVYIHNGDEVEIVAESYWFGAKLIYQYFTQLPLITLSIELDVPLALFCY